MLTSRQIILDDDDKQYPENISRVTNDCWKTPAPTPIVARSYAQKYLVSILNLVPGPVIENVMHLRSGDIFNSPHRLYFQPPLSYYKRYLSNPTVIVYENKLNPCIDKLLLEDNVSGQSSSFKNDFSILMRGKHVILGFSSIATALYVLSKNLTHLTLPSNYYNISYPIQEFGNEINIEVVDVSDYINNEPWKNTPEQLHRMLTYIIPEK
jgi:hypothetical protein